MSPGALSARVGDAMPLTTKSAISYRALGAVLLGAAAVALSSLGHAVNRAPQAIAGPKGADAEPAQMLKEMTEYLRNLQAFRVQAFSVDEVVTEAGTKLQLPTSSVITVARPNRVASEQLDDKNGLSFFYDGKSMALYCRADRTYAVAAAPPTLDATIDLIRKDYGIEAPGADLLYSRPYDVLMEQVKSGELVGHELLGGKMTRHLAFQGDEVDWQIWIAEGAEPLPAPVRHHEQNDERTTRIQRGLFALGAAGESRRCDVRVHPTRGGQTGGHDADHLQTVTLIGHPDRATPHRRRYVP